MADNDNIHKMFYDYLMERANDYYREYCAAAAAKVDANGDTPMDDELKTAVLAYGILTGEALRYYVNHADAFRVEGKKRVVRDDGNGTVYMAEEDAD